MGKLTEQTIIKTVEEMIHEECDPGWIREEVEWWKEREDLKEYGALKGKAVELGDK